MAHKSDPVNLTKSLEELGSIVSWFENKTNVDVEVGLEKVRAAAALITTSKTRLTEIENEFRELEKEISGGEVGNQ